MTAMLKRVTTANAVGTCHLHLTGSKTPACRDARARRAARGSVLWAEKELVMSPCSDENILSKRHCKLDVASFTASCSLTGRKTLTPSVLRLSRDERLQSTSSQMCYKPEGLICARVSVLMT